MHLSSNNSSVLLDTNLVPNLNVEILTTKLLQTISLLSPSKHTFGIALLLSLQSTVRISDSCLPSYCSVVKWFYNSANKEEFIIAHKEG